MKSPRFDAIRTISVAALGAADRFFELIRADDVSTACHALFMRFTLSRLNCPESSSLYNIDVIIGAGRWPHENIQIAHRRRTHFNKVAGEEIPGF